MYQEFLQVILIYIAALNEADKKIDALGYDSLLFPTLERIPLVMDEQIVGYLVDEIGGIWSYASAERS